MDLFVSGVVRKTQYNENFWDKADNWVLSRRVLKPLTAASMEKCLVVILVLSFAYLKKKKSHRAYMYRKVQQFVIFGVPQVAIMCLFALI